VSAAGAAFQVRVGRRRNEGSPPRRGEFCATKKRASTNPQGLRDQVRMLIQISHCRQEQEEDRRDGACRATRRGSWTPGDETRAHSPQLQPAPRTGPRRYGGTRRVPCRICARVSSRCFGPDVRLMFGFLVLGNRPLKVDFVLGPAHISPCVVPSLRLLQDRRTTSTLGHRLVGSTKLSLSVRSGVRSLKGPQHPAAGPRQFLKNVSAPLTGASLKPLPSLATSRPPSPSEANHPSLPGPAAGRRPRNPRPQAGSSRLAKPISWPMVKRCRAGATIKIVLGTASTRTRVTVRAAHRTVVSD